MEGSWNKVGVNARHQGDPLGDQLFQLIREDSYIAEQFYKLKINKDLKSFNNPVAEFSLSSSIDELKLRKAIIFFQKYTREILAVLGLYSLPYCYAGANGVQVLYHSAKIKSQPSKRLLETAQFVFDVSSMGGFQKEGKALVSILKVRIMHAAARHYSQKYISDEIAINQEDILGTILSFSLLVIRGLRKLGIPVNDKETENYLYLWRIVGSLMGLKSDYLPRNIREAAGAERVIRKKEFRPSAEGQELTRVLLNYIAKESNETFGDPERVMSYLMGNEVARHLKLKELSTLEVEGIKTTSLIVNGLKHFSEINFESVLKQFSRNLDEQKLDPDFNLS